MFTVVSTFSGCGGSSLGYQMAGGKVLLAVEWDNDAVKTYKANFPSTDIYHGDIANLSVEEVLLRTNLKSGELDVLDGSPPCQGFSTAGKREFKDHRNQLFKEYCRLLKGLQPKCFVMENVSGMIKGQMKLIFAEVLKELKSCGYKVKAALLNAKNYKVPQSRERMIFVGVRNDLPFEPSHPQGSSIITYPQKLDGRAAKYSHKRYGDELCSTKKPVGTITKIGRKFWDKHTEFGIKSYTYCGGFPLQFEFFDLSNAKNRIGNSVPPPLMKAIAEHLKVSVLNG